MGLVGSSREFLPHKMKYFPSRRRGIHRAHVPKHDCLRLISNCEDRLGWKLARRLITMEKIKEPSSIEEVAYYSDHREFGGKTDGTTRQVNAMSLREKILRGNDGAVNKQMREELQNSREKKKQKKSDNQ